MAVKDDGNGAAVAASAPAPRAAESAKEVKTLHPTDEFVVGDLVVTKDGSQLSAADVSKVVDAAHASGVRIVVDGDEVKKGDK